MAYFLIVVMVALYLIFDPSIDRDDANDITILWFNDISYIFKIIKKRKYIILPF